MILAMLLRKSILLRNTRYDIWYIIYKYIQYDHIMYRTIYCCTLRKTRQIPCLYPIPILDFRRVWLCFEVLGALFSPFHYVIGVFNFIWAIIIALIDGEASWFAKCGNCRATLFQWFPVFGTLPGRSFLHFYVPRLKELFMLGTFGTLRFIYQNIANKTESTRYCNEL